MVDGRQLLCVKNCLRWGEPVEVFGQRVEPGQLVHADKHGFIAIPKGRFQLILVDVS